MRLVFIAFVLFVLAIWSIYGYNEKYKKQEIELEKYINTILSMLKDKYPDADIIEVVSIKDLNNTKLITVRLTFNYTSPCPKRYHAYFNYPEYLTKEVKLYQITWDCNLCKNKPCKLIFKEEAIIAAYNKLPWLKNKRPLDIKVSFDKVWNVTFVFEDGNYSVLLDVNGSLINQSSSTLPQ